MGKKKKSKNHKYYDLDINLLDCKFLGKGNNGIVYMLPDGKVIKICFNNKSFIGESSILQRVNGNKYFPKIYEVGLNYMIRDYVDGVPLNIYIKENGLNKDLIHKIIKLLKEFKKLKFSKIDIRCRDIFVQPNGNLMIIDPKKCYSKYRTFPQHLAKGLYILGVLDYFLDTLKTEEPELYEIWNRPISDYIRSRNV